MNRTKTVRDAGGESPPDDIGTSIFITNDGKDEKRKCSSAPPPPKLDQRSISTIPAPPEGIIHAERQTFIVNDVNGYPELAMLRSRGTTDPPDLTKLDDELRGCSPGFIAGFIDRPLPDNAEPSFASEHIRGEMARYERHLNGAHTH